jgi:hypothetical protein
LRRSWQTIKKQKGKFALVAGIAAGATAGATEVGKSALVEANALNP